MERKAKVSLRNGLITWDGHSMHTGGYLSAGVWNRKLRGQGRVVRNNLEGKLGCPRKENGKERSGPDTKLDNI